MKNIIIFTTFFIGLVLSSFLLAADGFVKLEFDLNKQGRAENIKVIETNLKEEFSKIAVQKVKENQFSAKIVNGKAIRQNKLIYTMQFVAEN